MRIFWHTARTAVALCTVWSASVVYAVDEPGDGLVQLTEQIDLSNQELVTLRDQIKDHREQIRMLANEAQSAERELQNLNYEMGLVKNLLTGLNNREGMLQQQSDSLRVRLTEYEEEYRQQQELLAQRLRAIYIHGNRRHLELILTAGSFSSLVTRLKFATIMARLDRQLMEQMKADGRQILSAQSQLREALAGIWEAREEANQERRRLEMMDQDRRAVLTSLQYERQEAEKDLVRLQMNEQRLSELLADLEQQRQAQANQAAQSATTQSSFAVLAGSLDWPVVGEMIRGFGRSVHPEYKTVTLNNGINIAAPQGSPVYAIAVGTVEFADHLPGFGVCVILDHGAGYYSLYAHLDRLFVTKGSQVNQNEILAEVGEAVEGGGSQLYFEIRQGKTPLDPTQWLRSRSRPR